MAVDPLLKQRAEEVRDETNVGGNTATRVGQLLVDMVEEMGNGANVVNDTTTGGATEALSAEMGKVIRQNIMRLLNELGNYAFPNGKPALDWSGGDTPVPTTWYIIQSLVNVSGNAPLTVDDSDPLDVQLSLIDNMWVIDDDTVQVTMGGVDVTATAYDPDLMEVHIDHVIGDVEIRATGITYVSSDLVFNLDGLNRGGTAGHWKDIIGNVDFTLTNCTENSDNVEFNGTSSKGVSSGTLNVLCTDGTIEAIFDCSDSNYPTSVNVQNVLTNNIDKGICIGLGKDNSLAHTSYCYSNVTGVNLPVTGLFGWDDVIKTKQQVSISKGMGYRNNVVLNDNDPTATLNFAVDTTTPLAIGYRGRSLNTTPNENFMKGKIFMIRVYSRALTLQEKQQNYKVDKKRFNLS